MIPTSRPSLAADLKFLTRAIFAPVRTFEESLLFLRTTILLFFILVPVADVLGAQSYGYHCFKLYGDFIGYSVLSFATYRYRSMLFAILLILAEVTDLSLISNSLLDLSLSNIVSIPLDTIPGKLTQMRVSVYGRTASGEERLIHEEYTLGVKGEEWYIPEDIVRVTSIAFGNVASGIPLPEYGSLGDL